MNKIIEQSKQKAMTIPEAVKQKIEERAEFYKLVAQPEGVGTSIFFAGGNFGYSLSQQEIDNKDKEIDLLEVREVAWGNKVSQLNEEIAERNKMIFDLCDQMDGHLKEIERLKGLISKLWWRKIEVKYYGLQHPETNENLWQQFKTDNNIEDKAIYTGNSLK